MKRREFWSLGPLLLSLACGLEQPVQSTDAQKGSPTQMAHSQALYSTTGTSMWGPGAHIPVCWVTPGFDAEKEIIVNALGNTWERFGNVTFDWSGICPTVFWAPWYVRVLVERGSDSGGGGSSLMGRSALLPPTSDTTSKSTHIALPQSGSVGRIEYLGVHELGHVLGFAHEQDRPDNTTPDEPTCNPPGSQPGTTYTAFDQESVMDYCNSGGNGSGRLSDGDKFGVATAYGPAQGGLLLSDSGSNLAVNAYGGARHGADLRLVANCTKQNPDCTWTYRDGMLLSDANPSLAVNAYGGAQHGTTLRLVNNCTKDLPDCTWTYKDGMFLSDSNPSLAINAYGGANPGAVLKLVNDCSSANPTCTWTHRNTMFVSDTNSGLAMNAYGGATHGASLLLVSDCSPTNWDCNWTLHKGMILNSRDPSLAVSAYGGAANGTSLRLQNGCTASNPDCRFTLHRGMVLSENVPGLAVNAYGGAQHGAPLKLVNDCTSDLTDCTWTDSRGK